MNFIDNKYKKIYFSLIEKRKQLLLKKSEVYCEEHHIIPKSLGGKDDKNNLVNLTAREHYVAHKLLTKMTGGQDKIKMFWAFHRLLHSKNSNFKINSKNYELFRKQWCQFIKDNHPSKTSDKWCEYVSEKIKKSWETDYKRKNNASEKMKENWSNGKLSREQSIINGRHGLKGKLIHNTLEIEYKGKIYYGWRELKEYTGVSKALYNKYYLNNIDPEKRIGKNGPTPKNLLTIIERKEVSV
jgi:hypothetical protein